MPFIILAIDHEDKNEQREGVRDTHRKHLRSVGSKLLASGALLDDAMHFPRQKYGFLV